jgi:hypothetical protein
LTIVWRANSGNIIEDVITRAHWLSPSSIHLEYAGIYLRTTVARNDDGLECRGRLERKLLTHTTLKNDVRLKDGTLAESAWMRNVKSAVCPSNRRIRLAIALASIGASIATLPMTMKSQSLATPADTGNAETSTASAQPDLSYVPPTEKTKAVNYVFDAFGPYPLFGAAFAAGLNQSSDSPPEWGQGGEGYGKRIGSAFGIAATTTTARYGLARAFKEDTLYYRCACKGVFPRLTHAALSTLTARQGNDGHRVFSIPALLAPYAGSFTAVYGWYPDRFGPKDAFRIGNYTLLANVGENVALEFLYSGPHSLLSRLHLNDTRAAPRIDTPAAPATVTQAAPANDTHASPAEGLSH